MIGQPEVTVHAYPRGDARRRAVALWYFGVLIGVGSVVGHLVLGFEQSWAQAVVAIVAALAAQLGFEAIDARLTDRTPRYCGDAGTLALFFMPAWIAGNAVSFLIFPGSHFLPLIFASATSIASKVLVRAPVARGTQHVFNPSNFGITLTLFLFPSVGLAPPYHFTENVTGGWAWVVPGVILVTGVGVHAITGRMPLVLGWLVGFLVQALVRSSWLGAPILPMLVPMTSAAFTLFSLFMIPDPATTPIRARRQVAFGAACAVVYAALLLLHVVYGLFLALLVVSALRGVGLWMAAWAGARRPVEVDSARPLQSIAEA